MHEDQKNSLRRTLLKVRDVAKKFKKQQLEERMKPKAVKVELEAEKDPIEGQPEEAGLKAETEKELSSLQDAGPMAEESAEEKAEGLDPASEALLMEMLLGKKQK